MKQMPVSSETFRSLGYDPCTRTVEATFQSGDLYRYYAVPEAVWRGFKAASSKGRFFAEHIRDHYKYEKIH